VYGWGCGPCLGTGSVDATSAKPKLIAGLQPFHIVDIAVGDSHCVALTKGLLLKQYYTVSTFDGGGSLFEDTIIC